LRSQPHQHRYQPYPSKNSPTQSFHATTSPITATQQIVLSIWSLERINYPCPGGRNSLEQGSTFVRLSGPSLLHGRCEVVGNPVLDGTKLSKSSLANLWCLSKHSRDSFT
jgi:hypothetical protein